MRRDRGAENGLIEFLVAALIAECPAIGVRRLSLNYAMFRSVFSATDSVGAGPIMRLTAAVLSVASRFWQVESLYRSNAKYQPEWVARYLCYDQALSLAHAALAAGMAEGFLPSPQPPAPDRTFEQVALPDGRTVSFADAVREITAAPAGLPGRRPTQQERARRAKIDLLHEAGHEAYPVAVERTGSVADVRARYAGLPAGQHTGDVVSLAGRIGAARDFGGVTFAVLYEGNTEIQLMLTAEGTPADAHLLWRRAVDLGDQVSVTGEIVASKRGELSILVAGWSMAAKCLRPLPNPRTGLTDPEARVRQRHLDLLVNPDARGLLVTRAAAVEALRNGLRARGFVEVETPILQLTAGGAAARPFRTRSQTYDTDLFLRIAPELQLKRLCVAGMNAIFEIGRNFRNEGTDATHNPEFTVLEAYQAWSDYHGMRELTQMLLLEVARCVHGEPVAVRPNASGAAHRVELDGDWPVVTVHDAISAACGEPVTPDTPIDRLHAIAARHAVRWARGAGAGEVIVALYEALVEKQTVTPTFYIDFPVSACPLARTHRDDSRLAERWDLVAFGMEIATAYSELIDPVEQRARLVEQARRAALGDPEAMYLDETFLSAMEYAMPPTGGLGIGVDRLVMLLTGANIRATLAFPFARPVNCN
jgi:lysyl-tRNA synthetase class 2